MSSTATFQHFKARVLETIPEESYCYVWGNQEQIEEELLSAGQTVFVTELVFPEHTLYRLTGEATAVYLTSEKAKQYLQAIRAADKTLAPLSPAEQSSLQDAANFIFVALDR